MFIGVGNKAKPVVCNAKFFGYGRNLSHHMTQYFFVFSRDVSHRADLFLGDQQDVSRGLGVDVFKCQANIVLEHNVSRDFAVDNFLKYAHEV